MPPSPPIPLQYPSNTRFASVLPLQYSLGSHLQCSPSISSRLVLSWDGALAPPCVRAVLGRVTRSCPLVSACHLVSPRLVSSCQLSAQSLLVILCLLCTATALLCRGVSGRRCGWVMIIVSCRRRLVTSLLVQSSSTGDRQTICLPLLDTGSWQTAPP